MKTLLLLLSRKTQIKYENELGEQSGIIFTEAPRANRENVPLMLLIKALIVFLALMGSVECYMSGFGIAYDFNVTVAAAALVSVVFTLANTRLSLTAAVYGTCIYLISDYLNTGFQTIFSGCIAIVNMSYKLIMQKYKFPSVDGFAEMIPDRSVTVPAVIILGTVIVGMILAFFICRFMNVMFLSIITMLPLVAVLFFDGKPSLSSVAMLGCAWILTAVIKFSSKFGHVRFKRYMNSYYLKDKIYYKQMCDGTAVLQSVIIMLVMLAFTGGLIYQLFSPPAFDSVVKPSKAKQQIDYTVRDTMIIAFSNYKKYKITSYVSSGQLGFYGNVEPDFETDLKVSLVPYTTDRTYLRSYIGSDYKYKANLWTNKEAKNNYVNKAEVSSTAKAVAKSGVSAKININNIAVAGGVGYMPYYTDIEQSGGFEYVQDDIINSYLPQGENKDITYYPLTDGSDIDAEISEEYRAYVYKKYMSVPKELTLRLNSLCSGQGFKADDENVEQKINNYFQNNFTYDMQSGRLPWQTDFVEYFLFENPRGVCAHFASAATLIYRSIGIPARYVEGYCIDYPQVMAGTKKTEYNAEDWLTGAKPLSPYVMETELSDYNAHAWVEIYKDNIGWVPVDPTPYVDPDDVKTEAVDTSMLEELIAYFGDSELKFDEKGGISGIANVLVILLRLIIVLVILLAVYFAALRPIIWSAFRRIVAKRDKRRAVKLSVEHIKNVAVYCGITENNAFYRDLCHSLINSGMDSEAAFKMLKLSEKAVYAQNGITDAEYTALLKLIRLARRVVLKAAPLTKKLTALIIIVK